MNTAAAGSDAEPHAPPAGVRPHRRAARLTQAELASDVGVSRQTIVAIEKGDYAPSVFLALRLARSLETTVENLFSLEGDPS